MRKRNKTARGSRALTARRGNSRVPGNRTDSSSSNNRNGRGGGSNGRGGRSPVIITSGNVGQPLNGVFKPAIPERYCRNGISVGAGSAAMLSISTSNGIASDFYLHKKFKKIADVSDDNLSTTGGTGSASEDGDWKQNKEQNNRSNVTSNNGSSATTSSSNLCNGQASNEQGPSGSSSASSSSVVYKPKFRIVDAASPQEETSQPAPTTSSMSSASALSSTPPLAATEYKPSPPVSPPGEKKIVPGKINGERMDRQSLDDRISKIIDENQSILNSITEPWGKKHRSRQQSQSIPADLSSGRNGIVIMSGGSLGNERTPPPSTTVRPVEAVTVLPVAPVSVRSHSDAGGHIMPAEAKISPENSTEVLAAASGGNTTVVPKKRRRLSPTPNRFCGGEVSELPAQEASSVTKSYYQDVDMTVRVSKCGTSGAKVTIRTSNGSTAGSYSRLLDVPSTSPLKIPQPDLLRGESTVVLVHTGGTVEQQQQRTSHLSPLRYSPPSHFSEKQALKGRPPKKGKIESLGHESPVPIVAGATSPLTSVIVNAAVKAPPPSSPIPAKPTQVSPPVSAASVMEVTVIKTEVEEPEVSKANSGAMSPPPLLLQSSAPNPKRPNFLALKPVNPWPKKADPGVLPSPETPRGARTYNQMYINGQAYTYLGFKVSTRSSYTCLFKPQPMFLPQESDPKLSMYSNWQPRPRGKNQDDLPISLNDSRVNGRKSPRNFLFTLAGQKCATETVDSPDKNKTFLAIPEELKGLSTFTPSSAAPSAVVTQTERSEANLVIRSSKQEVPQEPLESPPKPEVCPSSSKPLNLAGSSKDKNQFYSSRNNGAMIEAISSSSSSGSADESVNLTVDRFKERSRISFMDSQHDMRPLALVASRDSQDASRESMQEGDDDKSSCSYSQFDNPRVRIMEGGFESNEDYTYVRGRGRGRYVCEACGIRCKKPSMLRKHLKTHTDLRPYTCKLCNFSFKTKGNLTKHQKSKSHHKKCLGLGIHPESQRSLAMIGPQFSDTNSTDESDDEEDNGVYNGDTDSQDEIDADDLSSSAEPETMESHSFEKEIAQSLLDLSNIGRVSSAAPREVLESKATDSATKMNHSQSRTERPNGFRLPVTVVDDNSSSQESCNVEAPMDLSCRGKTSSESDGDAKRFKLDKNTYVRSFGVVSEAQKWEPEEEFMVTGCLNLKKVPNDNNNVKGGSSSSSNPINGFLRVNGAVMNPPDVKPEVRTLNLNNNICEKSSSPYDFQLAKRKREPSTSSNCSESMSFAHSPKQQKSSGLQLSSMTAGQAPPKPQRLHQPWLSPEEPKCSAEVIIKQDVDSLRRSPSVDSYEQKVLDSCDLNREPGLLATVEPQRPVPPLSPSAKLFPGLAGLKPQAEFREPSGPQALVKDEGKAECNVCGKVFARASQLSLHMNIHYLERPFRCDPCGVSFRTKGHLIKHRRSSSHDGKVKVCLNDSWGVANEENPRPFKCPDCKIAFRIHGHLAKHLRSKMHIMRMECLGKLPFGIYFEMEKCGLNLTEIDTSDCDMSLISLQGVAKKIYGDSWTERLTVPIEEPV